MVGGAGVGEPGPGLGNGAGGGKGVVDATVLEGGAAMASFSASSVSALSLAALVGETVMTPSGQANVIYLAVNESSPGSLLLQLCELLATTPLQVVTPHLGGGGIGWSPDVSKHHSSTLTRCDDYWERWFGSVEETDPRFSALARESSVASSRLLWMLGKGLLGWDHKPDSPAAFLGIREARYSSRRHDVSSSLRDGGR